MGSDFAAISLGFREQFAPPGGGPSEKVDTAINISTQNGEYK
jgi:hypothetical protein